jgi:beta-N-acetylhexosaminidase
MKRKFFILLFLLVFISGCSRNAGQPDTVPRVTPSPAVQVEVKKDPIEEMIKSMTLDEKVGQLVLLGLNGTRLNSEFERLITRYHIGGVVLFKRNIEGSSQLISFVESIKSCNNVNKLPLFVSIDEEGGRVSRLPLPKKFPASRIIGKKNSRDIACKNGGDIAKALASYGFNMNLAPVLDILTNPKNTVIGDRSFGNNPQIVSSMGIAEMKGMQDNSIIPVVKHFPGHGSTKVDSHYDAPVVNYDKKRLDSFELIPFKEAVNNGADAIMTAHIYYPEVDSSGKPATMSKVFLTDILRGEMGFQGIVITDDIGMGSISKKFELKKASMEAISAGADMLLVCNIVKDQEAVMEALKEAVGDGTLTEERINMSLRRILKLKAKYKLWIPPTR